MVLLKYALMSRKTLSQQDLHSTMVLLKFEGLGTVECVVKNLHSTMVLLKLMILIKKK